MNDRAVARVVQARAAAVGNDPGRFAGHSLRAGLITAGARAGAGVFKLEEVSRHRSIDVLASCVCDGNLFEDYVGERLLRGILVRTLLRRSALVSVQPYEAYTSYDTVATLRIDLMAMERYGLLTH